MPEPQSADEDLDVTLRWPGGAAPAPVDLAEPDEPSPVPTGPASRTPGPPAPVRVRPGGSALAALRDEVAELRAQVEALTAEVAALRDG